MKPSLRYLNSVLTVIAILLTLNLATMWTASPAPDQFGLSVDMASDAYAAKQPPSPPNAAVQRKQLIEEMRKMSKTTQDLASMFRSGQARVKVDNMPTDRP